jgi:hypothetical protein
MTQSELEAALALYEFVRGIGQTILMAGLMCEILVVVFLHGSGKPEIRASIVAVVVVMIGVGVENLYGSKADATVRALEAPRALNETQFVSALKPFAGTHFDLSLTPTLEPLRLLEKIEAGLKQAGWAEERPDPSIIAFDRGGGAVPVSERTVAGVWVIFPDKSGPRYIAAGKALSAALRAQGINGNEIELTGTDPTDLGRVHVWVGEKP